MKHVTEDIRLAVKRKGGYGALIKNLLVNAGLQAVALYRLSHWFYTKGWMTAALFVMRLNHLLCNVEITPDTEIGPDFHLHHPVGVVIGPRVKMGKGVRIYSTVALGALWREGQQTSVEVRDYAMIYHGAKVGGHCVVGEFAQVGLNAVSIFQDIPPYAVVVGNPGRVVKILGEKVDSADYKDYKYNPDDYHGPPPGIEPDNWED